MSISEGETCPAERGKLGIYITGYKGRKGKTIPKYKHLQISEEVKIIWQFRSSGEIWKLEWALIMFPHGFTEERWRRWDRPQGPVQIEPILTWQRGRSRGGETEPGRSVSRNSFSSEKDPPAAVRSNSVALLGRPGHS